MDTLSLKDDVEPSAAEQDRLKRQEQLIQSVYTDVKNPAAFAGINVVWREVRKQDPTILRRQVVDALQHKDTYSKHKPARFHFQRRRFVPSGYLTDFQVKITSIY